MPSSDVTTQTAAEPSDAVVLLSVHVDSCYNLLKGVDAARSIDLIVEVYNTSDGDAVPAPIQARISLARSEASDDWHSSSSEPIEFAFVVPAHSGACNCIPFPSFTKIPIFSASQQHKLNVV